MPEITVIFKIHAILSNPLADYNYIKIEQYIHIYTFHGSISRLKTIGCGTCHNIYIHSYKYIP
jgi:hypothetical protein